MHQQRILIVVLTTLLFAAPSRDARAQAGAAAPAGGAGDGAADLTGGGAPAAGAPNVVILQGPAAGGGSGSGQPAFDPNSHLPSSSRAVNDINKSDSFDLGREGGSGGTVRGGASSSYVVEGQASAEAHSVRRGDTLWDVSAQYFRNPYTWPRLWAMNPQIQNPHWIYPGDRLRLRDPGEMGARPTLGSVGVNRRRKAVPPATVFLRNVGWVDEKEDETWGSVVGSPRDNMLLSETQEIYIEVAKGHDAAGGQELSLFLPLHEVESEADGNERGMMVAIVGTVRVDRYNEKTRMARARIVEATGVIERGVSVGPVGTKFDVVPPSRNEQDIEAHLLSSLYPHALYSQNQVVFIDKGEKDGVQPGNRFFAISRVDPWQRAIGKAGTLAKYRPKTDEDDNTTIEKVFLGGDEEVFPDETYAELRVLRVRDHTALCLVTTATREIERNARVVARKGY